MLVLLTSNLMIERMLQLRFGLSQLMSPSSLLTTLGGNRH